MSARVVDEDGVVIAVEGVVALGGSEQRVFGFATPQVPAAGERIEHPEGVLWSVLAVRWIVGRGDDVSAVLTVEPE